MAIKIDQIVIACLLAMEASYDSQPLVLAVMRPKNLINKKAPS